jgi:hypothetical protein
MKTVHWPRRCPPLSSLSLNRLLGHASKRTPDPWGIGALDPRKVL